MNRTNGRGVDVVFNSLVAELMEASIRCLADKGQFVELGKMEHYRRTLIDSYFFLKGCSYHAIVLDKLFDSRIWIKKLLQKLVAEGMLTF